MRLLRHFLPATSLGMLLLVGGPSLSGQGADSRPGSADLVARRLLAESGGPRPGAWQALPRCPRGAPAPAALCAAGSTLVLVAGDRVERFDVRTGAWAKRPLRLPRAAGPGVAICAADGENAFFTSGGGRRTLWHLDLAAATLKRLPDAPAPVGRGAGLQCHAGRLYLMRGVRSYDFHAFDLDTRRWSTLQRIGGGARMPRPGAEAGGLLLAGGALYAWADHHLQRFDLKSQRWGGSTWMGLGFRPATDGGMAATDARSGVSIFLQGACSRALIAARLEERQQVYLRPRLPVPLQAPGNRAAIVGGQGAPRLYVYARHPEERLWRLSLASCSPVTPANPAVEAGSVWRRVTSIDGGSGVRRRGAVGEPGAPLRPGARGVVGVLGRARDGLFLMRLAGVRRFDPARDSWTFYPGWNLGDFVLAGACAAWDGASHLYLMPGESGHLTRWKIPEGAPLGARKGPQPAYHETSMERLSPAPAPLGRGASAAWSMGALYVLRGGATREFMRFDPRTGRWDSLPSLPLRAAAPGVFGTGLATSGDHLFAFPDRQVWRFDRATHAWSPFLRLPFTVSWDGGMLATDPSDGRIWCVAGGVSTRLGVLDPARSTFTEITQRPPDPVSAEGNRLAILTVSGQPRLYIHRGHDSNELWYAPLSDLALRRR